MSCHDRLIVALDYPKLAPALAMARRLRGLVRTVKVGSALFTAEGPLAIQRLRALGLSVMLDLKFFDIPSTVELSCRAAVRHRVSLLTVHAAGGREMLEAAVQGAHREARRLGIRRPEVLGVTVLTSVGGQPSKWLKLKVLLLAELALEAGCDGIVASAQEAAALRKRFGRRLRIVCPGIRTTSASQADQRRVSTPAEALARGADALVVGRPVTAAAHPRAVVQAILNAMETVDGC